MCVCEHVWVRVFVYVRRRIHKLHWIREVGIWRIRILTNIWYKGGEVCVWVYIHMCVYMDVEKLNAFIYYIGWWWGATLSWYCHFIPLFFPFSVSRFFLTFLVLCCFVVVIVLQRILCVRVCMTQSSTVTTVSWIIYNIMYIQTRGYSSRSRREKKHEKHRNFLRGSFFTSSPNNTHKEEWPILKIFLLFFRIQRSRLFFVVDSCVRGSIHYIYILYMYSVV